MDNTPKLLEGKGMSALIFLSCIEHPKTKREITQDWGLAKDTRQIYAAGVGFDIEQLKKDNLLVEQEDGKLYSVFDGLKACIKYESEQKIGTAQDANLIVAQSIPTLNFFITHWDGFYNFINNERTRQELFKTENLLNLFGHKTEKAKAYPLLPFFVLPQVYSIFTSKPVKKNVKKAKEQIRLTAPILILSGAPATIAEYFYGCVDFFVAHEAESSLLGALSKDIYSAFEK